MTKNTTLYFAYGSNLDPTGMERRCPGSVVVDRAALSDWQLTFRGVADIEPAAGQLVRGAVWACTDEHVRSLDCYEGVAGGFYRREWVDVDLQGGGTVRALVYIMEPTPFDNASMPSDSYLGSITRGYAWLDLPTRLLREALTRTAERCDRKGVTKWRTDGRKRRVPANGPALRSSRRKALKEVPPTTDDSGYVPTREEALEMGISPATLAEMELTSREAGGAA